MFIGQHKLQESLRSLPPSGFIMLVGQKGSGRKTLLRSALRAQKRAYVPIGNKIDDIREMVEDSEMNGDGRVYVITDGDKMTVQAANALLKVAEEPPRNCLVVLLLTMLDYTLPTLISRARLLKVLPYTTKELQQYIDENVAGKYLEKGNDTFVSMVTNIGQIVNFEEKAKTDSKYLENLEWLVNFTIDNAFVVSSSNFLNISKYLRISKNSEESLVEFTDLLDCLTCKIGWLGMAQSENYTIEQLLALIRCNINARKRLRANRPLEQTVYNWAMEVSEI